jgi:hypothetical protein
MIASPPVASPNARSEKERHVREFMQRKRRQALDLADYVERHPESLQTAIEHVDRFLASPAHVRIHWILNQWRAVLSSSSSLQVAAILRDDALGTESLRESPPYFGPRDR